MGKHCPHCGSTNFHYIYNNWSGRGEFYCNHCGGYFQHSEDDRRYENECPTCGSTNTVYYNNSAKHHYCNDCGTRW